MDAVIMTYPGATPAQLASDELAGRVLRDGRRVSMLAAPLALAAGNPVVLLGGKKSLTAGLLGAGRTTPVITFAPSPADLYFYRVRYKDHLEVVGHLAGSPVKLARGLAGPREASVWRGGDVDTIPISVPDHLGNVFKTVTKDVARNVKATKKVTVILISLEALAGGAASEVAKGVPSPVTAGMLLTFLQRKGWAAD